MTWNMIVSKWLIKDRIIGISLIEKENNILRSDTANKVNNVSFLYDLKIRRKQ